MRAKLETKLDNRINKLHEKIELKRDYIVNLLRACNVDRIMEELPELKELFTKFSTLTDLRNSAR